MKSWKNLLIVAIGIFAITTVNAKQDNCCKPCPPSACECPSCCEIPKGPTTSAYNHPASIDVCGSWDFYVAGTFLWVLPCMEQLEFAQTTYAVNSTNIGTVHYFDYDWKPAFKVGFGFKFDHDNWEMYIQYLRINSNMRNTHTPGYNSGESLNSTVEYQVVTNNDTQACGEVTGKWHLDFNIFNLTFGRPYYNGKYLQCVAQYGLKGGWIENSFNQDATVSTTTYTSSLTSKSWLIGPKAEIQTKWTFDDGFRFFGNAAASLFFQKFYDVEYREYNSTSPDLWYLAYNYSDRTVNAAFESIIGIGWGTYFARNNWHYDLAIGYEAQLFLNQNQMARLRNFVNLDAAVNPVAKAGNLTFHGLNVTMKFDF